MFQLLNLSPQFLDLARQRLIGVTREHIPEHGTSGAEPDLIVLARLNQALQLVRRDGPQRRQSPHSGLH
jgi:hypothetical protein